MKILNLYAGIGGNRHLWGEDHQITAVEINSEIASVYKSKFPNDNVIVADAHSYLLEHYKEFDFIWSSPPCPSHSKLCYSLKQKKYIDVALYQQIILLKSWFKGKWVIENVVPYYEYLVEPSFIIGRHPFWSNFNVPTLEVKNIDISRSNVKELSEYLGIPEPKYGARLALRNCVEPKTGLHILNCAQGIIKENNVQQNKLF
jgi:DNA (cytosine-5)-methyltransferase 1|tara:strand:- start:2729 stop:3334 length:606 start_codon:yes stop_codon:yes gene_type:complete